MENIKELKEEIKKLRETIKWITWLLDCKNKEHLYPDWERDKRVTDGTEFNKNSQFIIK